MTKIRQIIGEGWQKLKSPVLSMPSLKGKAKKLRIRKQMLKIYIACFISLVRSYWCMCMLCSWCWSAQYIVTCVVQRVHVGLVHFMMCGISEDWVHCRIRSATLILHYWGIPIMWGTIQRLFQPQFASAVMRQLCVSSAPECCPRGIKLWSLKLMYQVQAPHLVKWCHSVNTERESPGARQNYSVYQLCYSCLFLPPAAFQCLFHDIGFPVPALHGAIPTSRVEGR